MSSNTETSNKHDLITQINDTGKQVFKSPETAADFFVTASALVACAIAISYLIRFFKR